MLKKPSTLKKINLANALPFDEFKLSQTSSECQKYGEIMKKFYFGFLPISEETIFVYLYVSIFIHSPNLDNNFTTINHFVSAVG